MQRTQWQRSEEPNHGLGWMIWHVDGITIRGHSGGFPGFTTKIGFSPELGLAAAALNNTSSAVPAMAVDTMFHCVAWVYGDGPTRRKPRTDTRVPASAALPVTTAARLES